MVDILDPKAEAKIRCQRIIYDFMNCRHCADNTFSLDCKRIETRGMGAMGLFEDDAGNSYVISIEPASIVERPK